jgi:hypothetical protein
MIKASPDNDDNVPLTRAVWEISKRADKPCSRDAVRKAAERIGALRLDSRGYGRIPRAVVNEMARNYAALGVFTRRGQRAVEHVG